MSNIKYTGRTLPFPHVSLGGGLNSSAGPLGLQDNESSDLRNIDFDKFGSIKKRSGYTALNTTAIGGSLSNYGLHWYEYSNTATGAYTSFAMAVNQSTTGLSVLYKMDDLDGTWDNIIGSITLSNNYYDFTNFLNDLYITAQETEPLVWQGSGNAAVMSTPSGLQWAKYNEEFNNYLFLANVKVNGIHYPSRFYWSTYQNTGSWTSTNYIDVSDNDGQEITRIKKLSDRLVVYKKRSIYNVFFTGDVSIPFVLPGGGKANSAVGCIAPFSVQEVDNGHVFFSHDGFYFYDGINSYKLSDKITKTLDTYEGTQFDNVKSMVQKNKNRYWASFNTANASQSSNVVTLDYFNKAWSVYAGMSPSGMAAFFVNAIDERPYFADYEGYIYRGDTGADDYPKNTQTAIDSYFYTNWKSYGDLIDKKGIDSLAIYYQLNNITLSFSYSYDLNTGDQFTYTIPLGGNAGVYDTARYGDDVYGSIGGAIRRVDLTDRGRLVRFKFANANKTETFQIDGFGALPYLETYV